MTDTSGKFAIGMTGAHSHWIELDIEHIRKENVYPEFTVVAKGMARRVRLSADRYYANGMTEWRIYITEIDSDAGIGPVTRQALRDDLVPMVEEWLKSDEYKLSYQRALAYAIANEIRNTTTIADYRAKSALASHLSELHPDAAERLQRAYHMRMESLRLLDGGF